MGCRYSNPYTRARIFLKSNESVNAFFDGKDIVFESKTNSKNIGILIYPGATHDPKGYAEIAFGLAENGYFVVICKAPLNYAILSSNKFLHVINKYTSKAQNWVIGGHSLGKFKKNSLQTFIQIIKLNKFKGGITSTKFLNDHRNLNKNIIGLFMWASIGFSKFDLRDLDIPTLLIYTELDNIFKKETVEKSIKYLPQKNLTVKLLKGANHTYFGDFIIRRNLWFKDNESVLTKEEQTRLITDETLKFLNTLSNSK